MELVYTRVSTHEQSTQRQRHVLAEAGLVDGAEGVSLFADPATSSRIPALERTGFRELADYARPGDRVTVSELYRLCRDLADILAVRQWCQAHEVRLRALSGPLSGVVDLAANDASTTMLVNVLAAVGQFQRDLQNELTREGLAAAWAAGAVSGRRPRLAQLGALEDVRAAYRHGSSIAELARHYQVSRVAVRTAIADLLPGRPERPALPADEPVVIEVPGMIARHLADVDELGADERQALAAGHTVRRGQGYSVRVTATAEVHRRILATAAALAQSDATSAMRKAQRIYAVRVDGLG